MRLDHLLSREPCCGAVWLLVLVVRFVRGVGAGGVVVLGGAWVLLAVCWWGASSLWGWAWGLCCCGRTGALSGSRPTPVAPPWGAARLLPCWGVAAPSLGGGGLWSSFLLVWGCVGFGPSAGSSPCWGGCGGCGGLFVICIVVASIFVVCARPPFLCLSCACAWGVWGGVWPAGPPVVVVVVGVFFVVCGFVGHSVDALAPRADEGRCGLRYAPGSWRASFDPGVSEWGNPARVVLGHHHLNVYRVVGGTRGSETSQYP